MLLFRQTDASFSFALTVVEGGLMRIVMVGDFPREAKEIGGGVEAVTSYLASALQNMPNTEIHGVTLDRWGGAARVEVQSGVPVHFVPLSTRPSRLSNWQNIKRMSEVISSLNPDLVHAHIANQYAAAARATGRPWVLTAHGIRHFEMALRPGLLNRYREWTVRQEEFGLMAAATHLISISPFVTETFTGSIRGDTTELDNPVNDAFFAAKREPSPGRILYVGRLIPRKDIITLLRAFDRARQTVPGCQLRLAGEGISGLEPEGYSGQLVRFIEASGMTDSVKFLGQLDDASLIDEYAQCEFMAVSSILETAPMVILQAMAAGVPVVSTDVGGIRYLVEDGSSGFIVPAKDAVALGERMSRILGSSELRQVMEARSREIAEERLRASYIARRTREVYDKSLQDSQRNRAVA